MVALLHWHTDPRYRYNNRSALDDLSNIAYERQLGLLEDGDDLVMKPRLFTEDECDRLIRHGEAREWRPALTDTDELAAYNEAGRKATVVMIDRRPAFDWMWAKLDMMAGRIGPAVESRDIQLLKYGDGGHHDWHHDDGDRTVSVVVLLRGSDGHFEIEDDGGPPIRPLRNAGDAVAFLSHKKHRVTRTTSGTRYTLAGWYDLPRARSRAEDG